jgi:hypothetical protein
VCVFAEGESCHAGFRAGPRMQIMQCALQAMPWRWLDSSDATDGLIQCSMFSVLQICLPMGVLWFPLSNHKVAFFLFVKLMQPLAIGLAGGTNKPRQYAPTRPHLLEMKKEETSKDLGNSLNAI